MRYDNIFEAVHKGTLDDIKNFFEHLPNPNPNLRAFDGRTPLFFLISSEQSIESKREIISYVISKGALVDSQDQLGDTPYFSAMSCGKIELGMIFLELGASKTNTNYYQVTPLMEAAKAGSMEMIDLILNDENGRNTLNFKNEIGKTALFYALEMGYVNIANYLLDQGADASVQTEYDGGLVTFAAIHGVCYFD